MKSRRSPYTVIRTDSTSPFLDVCFGRNKRTFAGYLLGMELNGG